MLKYINTAIVMAEVPDEISLAINISGCPHKCEGCHSPWLWEDKGEPLNQDTFMGLMEENKGVSCILFMGGDNDVQSLLYLAYLAKLRGFKVAWYSGLEKFPFDDENLEYFNYLKFGPYIKERGGLDNPNTNQVFFKVERVEIPHRHYILKDETKKFRRHEKD